MVGDGTWLTVNEAAQRLGISGWKVRQLLASGTLSATTVPDSRHVRILAAIVDDFAERRRREAAGEIPPGRHAAE
jgi:excisionase family DNA binding protein